MAHRRADGGGGPAGDGSSCANGRIRSVVSTFLVSFGVVAAAIVAIVHVVLSGPDQPPTIRPQSSRAKEGGRRQARKAPRVVPETVATVPSVRSRVGLPVTPALAGPDSEIMRLRVLPAGHNSVWVRIRSGIALVVLVAVLGALVALAVAGAGIGLALLLRSATG